MNVADIGPITSRNHGQSIKIKNGLWSLPVIFGDPSVDWFRHFRRPKYLTADTLRIRSVAVGCRVSIFHESYNKIAFNASGEHVRATNFYTNYIWSSSSETENGLKILQKTPNDTVLYYI